MRKIVAINSIKVSGTWYTPGSVLPSMNDDDVGALVSSGAISVVEEEIAEVKVEVKPEVREVFGVAEVSVASIVPPPPPPPPPVIKKPIPKIISKKGQKKS